MKGEVNEADNFVLETDKNYDFCFLQKNSDRSIFSTEDLIAFIKPGEQASAGAERH